MSRRSRMPGDGRSFSDSAHYLTLILAVVLVAVVAKLLWLQLIDAPSLRDAAAAQRTSALTIRAKRGTIFDRDGNVLAMSVDCKTVYCNPREVNDPNGAAKIMAEELGGEAADYLEPLTRESTFAYSRRQVDEDKAERLKNRLEASKVDGVYYLGDTKRVYPYGSVGGQVLGIVGTDGNGLSGLELYYDKLLSGTDGTLLLETGADGTPIAGARSRTTDAKNGSDIVISLDIDIQKVAEETIAAGVKQYEADSGSVIVTDPSTGEILAACSTPLFDITNTSVIEEGALDLKPVSSSFEPGSIFKLLTMSIGIENQVISTDTPFTVPAKVRVGDDMVGDDDGRDFTMVMDPREILRRSSNAGTALVAQSVIGSDAFAGGIQKFGIGQTTGIDFPGEVAGLVKSREQYDGASLGSMSFGQSLALPLVQMVKAVGGIANDGVLQTPHFLISSAGERQEWPSPGVAISKDTADQVTDMMRTVVQEGTAMSARVEGYDIAGKTGTGEQADDSGKYLAYSFVSSLIGFAPADSPRVLVYVGLNGTPYLASGSAAVLFSTIMGESLSDMGVQPSS